MERKFKMRGQDRRKKNVMVANDRRGGSRRTSEARKAEPGVTTGLQAALRSLETLISGIRQDLTSVMDARDPDEVTQIPTRNEKLADAVRLLSEAQAGLLEFVRATQQAARLTPELREWVKDVAGRAADVESELAHHMAERLHIDPPRSAPRAKRFTSRLERLLA